MSSGSRRVFSLNTGEVHASHGPNTPVWVPGVMLVPERTDLALQYGGRIGPELLTRLFHRRENQPLVSAAGLA